MRCSSSERIIACPASLIEPARLSRRTATTTAADYGTLAHHWMATGDAAPAWAGQDQIDLFARKLETCRYDRSKMPVGRSEVTFSLHLRTGAVELPGPSEDIPAWKARRQGRRWQLTGSIDLLIHDRDGWEVLDLKTGREAPAPTSPQLLSYALLPWAVAGWSDDFRVLLTIAHWPLYPLAGVPRFESRWARTDQLREHLAALKSSAANPTVFGPGDACLWCESREPHPASSWMQHYRHRALDTCHGGMLQLMKETK